MIYSLVPALLLAAQAAAIPAPAPAEQLLQRQDAGANLTATTARFVNSTTTLANGTTLNVAKAKAATTRTGGKTTANIAVDAATTAALVDSTALANGTALNVAKAATARTGGKTATNTAVDTATTAAFGNSTGPGNATALHGAKAAAAVKTAGAAALLNTTVPANGTAFNGRKAAVVTTAPPQPTSCIITTFPSTDIQQTIYSNGADGAISTITKTFTFSEEPGCVCDETIIADLITSVGSQGQKSIYCATGSYTSPNAVVTPTGTAGDANNGAWSEIKCNYGSLTNVYNDPSQQWNDSGAGAAYADVSQAYSRGPQGSFPTFLGNFFHSRPGLHCEELDNANCDVTINCGQGLTDSSQSVSAPAGYVLVNSLVGLHVLYDDVWNAINNALPLALGKMGTYVSTFSPVVDQIADQKRTKLILDGVQAALFVVLGPTFHSGFGRLLIVKNNPNIVAAGFDITYGGIGTIMASVKDAMESLSTLPIQNEMTAFISDAAHTWLTGLTKSAQLVFNSPSTLLSVINNGLTFAADTDHSPLDAITTVEKAMYASTIAGIWTAGDYLPVIITDQGVPQKGSGCSGWDPDSIGIDATTNYKGAFKNDVLTKARICDGDDAYWLLAVFAPHANPAAACVPTPTRPCPVSPNFAQFDNLKNLDGFDGSNWAGLKKEDILFNAVNTWKANGNKNGYTPLSTFNGPSDVANLVSADFTQLHGIVNIPVCSVHDIFRAAADGLSSGRTTYPCPS